MSRTEADNIKLYSESNFLSHDGVVLKVAAKLEAQESAVSLSVTQL